MRLRGPILLLVGCLVLTGCQLITAPPSREPAPSAEPTHLPTVEPIQLPSNLYLLSDMNDGVTQIWRLSPDGGTLTPLTTQTADMPQITDFDISPVGGQIAYLAGSQLVLLSPGGEPFILIDDAEAAAAQPGQLLQAPRWSPDGQVLAFGQGGINLYHPGSGSIANLLSDRMGTPDASSIQAEVYAPHLWSPNGQNLLVSVSQVDSSTLGILALDTGHLTLLSQKPVCCQAAWTDDSQAVLVANPYPEMGSTGLWIYQLEDGSYRELLPPIAADGTNNYAGWPLGSPAGEVLFFYANSPAGPQSELPFHLASLSLNQTEFSAALRPDAWYPKEVLWTSDGRAALVVMSAPGGAAWLPDGMVVLVQRYNVPARALVASGYSLRWGP